MSSKTNAKKREPLFHIAKREGMPKLNATLIRLGAVIAALIVCAIVTMALSGENPIRVYATMLDGAFGTSRRIWNLLQELAMLLCVSLA
ncbi:MAG: ABC transporter permease, partial [Eubacterium sp.]|nr:ABC transporter permease [Eubacterium sp.]